MPEYLAPGVYVEEVDTGSKPIEGVSTSTAGFVGMTLRGAIEGLPSLVTSFAEFERKFGGYFNLGSAFGAAHNYLPHAVEGFFANGGKRLYIMRVVIGGGSATSATTVAQGGLITRLAQDTSITPVGEQTKLRTVTRRGIRNGTKLMLRMIKNGVVTDSPVISVTAIDQATGVITVNNAPSTTVIFEAKYTTVFTDVSGLAVNTTPSASATVPPTLAELPDAFDISAKDVGSWGKSLDIRSAHESAARAEFSALLNTNDIQMKSAAGFYVGAWVEIDNGTTKRYRKVTALNGTMITVDGPALAAADLPANTIISTCEFRLTVSYGGTSEDYSGLTLENIPGRFYRDIINNSSSLITVGPPLNGTHPFAFPSGSNGTQTVLGTGGSDGSGAPSDFDYKGTDGGPGKRRGIKALEDIDQISIIAAPGQTSQVVQGALIEQCERLKDRFAILDPRPKAGNVAPDMNDIQSQRSLYDTKYAAIYYPRIMVSDPLSQTDMPVPPSGHVAGIYARTDIERGVHKAPANEVIRGITGLELKLNKEEQDILNPSPVNINVLRDFRSTGRGLRVWGARCITSDPDWKYVNVRRLFIFIEESIDEGTQWVVFEPNDEPLWERVRRTVTAFLTNVWRDGALQGKTPEEAFFVKCDRTTMTQADIDNGRLIVLVGIAPVRPAEFVIFRIGQWVGGSSVDEG
ncbi:MAG TPA: phage tail sheath C-terminal domain-containing protein [Pyrinomonadaceae bacterium]|jgi:hypothetical protein